MASLTAKELLNLGQDIWLTRTVIVAVELGVFELIGDNGATVEDLLARGDFSRRGLKPLLNAMVPAGLVEKDDGGTYRLTGLSREYLLPGTPKHIGHRLTHMSHTFRAWAELPESVRTGKPYWSRHPEARDSGYLVVLAEMLFDRNFGVSRKAAAALGVGKSRKSLRILDVAAGSGPWSLGFLAEDPSSKAVAVDFGPVLEMAKRKAAERGAGDRFEVLEGDIREVDFGAGEYGAAILGHICHSEGAEHSEKLIRKTARALAPGGVMIIADMIPDDDRRGPLHPLLFALNMLVNTEEGDTFTFSEYRAWCEGAGLENVRALDVEVEGHSPLIAADKARR